MKRDVGVVAVLTAVTGYAGAAIKGDVLGGVGEASPGHSPFTIAPAFHKPRSARKLKGSAVENKTQATSSQDYIGRVGHLNSERNRFARFRSCQSIAVATPDERIETIVKTIIKIIGGNRQGYREFLDLIPGLEFKVFWKGGAGAIPGQFVPLMKGTIGFDACRNKTSFPCWTIELKGCADARYEASILPFSGKEAEGLDQCKGKISGLLGLHLSGMLEFLGSIVEGCHEPVFLCEDDDNEGEFYFRLEVDWRGTEQGSSFRIENESGYGTDVSGPLSPLSERTPLSPGSTREQKSEQKIAALIMERQVLKDLCTLAEEPRSQPARRMKRQPDKSGPSLMQLSTPSAVEQKELDTPRPPHRNPTPFFMEKVFDSDEVSDGGDAYDLVKRLHHALNPEALPRGIALRAKLWIRCDGLTERKAEIVPYELECNFFREGKFVTFSADIGSRKAFRESIEGTLKEEGERFEISFSYTSRMYEPDSSQLLSSVKTSLRKFILELSNKLRIDDNPQFSRKRYFLRSSVLEPLLANWENSPYQDGLESLDPEREL